VTVPKVQMRMQMRMQMQMQMQMPDFWPLERCSDVFVDVVASYEGFVPLLPRRFRGISALHLSDGVDCLGLLRRQSSDSYR